MTIHTTARAMRRTFPVTLARIAPHPAITREQPCASRLSQTELRRLVAAMVD